MVPGAQDILESLDEPGPLDAHDNDPVVKEGEHLGSGVGVEEEGDHVEAVVRVADEKDIPTQLENTDGTQPKSETSILEVEIPGSSLIQEPGMKDEIPPSEKLDLSTETMPPQDAVHPMEQPGQTQRPAESSPTSACGSDTDQGPLQDQHVASPPEEPGDSQVSATADADQKPGFPVSEEQASTSGDVSEVPKVVQDEPIVAMGLEDPTILIQEGEHSGNGSPAESQEPQQNLVQNSSQREATPQGIQPEDSRTEGLLKEDAQGPNTEQSVAEDATQDLASIVGQDNEQQTEPAFKSTQNENHLQQAGLAVHETSSDGTDGANHSLDLGPESIDEAQRRSTTADKATEMLSEEALPQRDIVDEVLPISSAEPHSSEDVPLHKKPSRSLSIVDGPPSSGRYQAVQPQIDEPFLGRADSSTQTDELWRPITPIQRGPTPGIVLPDLNDEHAKSLSRARSKKRMTRRNSRKAEAAVAAAVIIRATADTMGESSATRPDVVEDLKQHGGATTSSKSIVDRRGTGVAVTDTARDPFADSIIGKESPKTDDNVPMPPRTREHRSSHSSRSDRPSTAKSSHHRRSSHRLRADGERESEQTGSSPRTPPRRRDTAESGHGSHSSRTKKERTPEEQADHDRRKEAYRLEKAAKAAKADSPEAKVKEVESPAAERRPKSSRRQSSSRNGPETAPGKKLFSGESVLESNFGAPLAADTAPPAIKEKDVPATKEKAITKPPPAELKRSNTTRKAREQEAAAKASKEKSRGRGASSSPAPSAESKKRRDDDKHRKIRSEKREKGEKDEKKSSGGIKGMFKKLFS